jgi:ring-1,2-phenylacetyl-CoA epoxidase subunit PaaA
MHESPNYRAKLMLWKIKRLKANDELRQQFVDMIAEQVKVLGMTLPDQNLKWNEPKNCITILAQ